MGNIDSAGGMGNFLNAPVLLLAEYWDARSDEARERVRSKYRFLRPGIIEIYGDNFVQIFDDQLGILG